MFLQNSVNALINRCFVFFLLQNLSNPRFVYCNQRSGNKKFMKQKYTHQNDSHSRRKNFNIALYYDHNMVKDPWANMKPVPVKD